MNTNKNIGNWSAVFENVSRTAQIVVSGVFPTFGQRPLYQLIKNDPEGIVDTELLLTLSFGTLINTEGSVYFSVVQTFPIEHTHKYKTVLVIDENERTIANINIVSENQNLISEPNSFQPYLEVLKGVEITRTSLKLRVPSNGLTSKESFKIRIIKGFTGMAPYLLEIFRVEPDYGKAFIPDGIVLEYTPQELKENVFPTFMLSNLVG